MKMLFLVENSCGVVIYAHTNWGPHANCEVLKNILKTDDFLSGLMTINRNATCKTATIRADKHSFIAYVSKGERVQYECLVHCCFSAFLQESKN